MTYELAGSALLFEIDRSRIIDISPGDTITVQGFQDLKHVWTVQDREFIENNPDDDIFIAFKKTADGIYQACGIQLRPVEMTPVKK